MSIILCYWTKPIIKQEIGTMHIRYGKKIGLGLSVVLLFVPFFLFGGCGEGKDYGSKSVEFEQVKDFPNTEVGNMLEEHFGIMVSVGENAEEKYQSSLEQLRGQIPEVIRLISDVYHKMDTTRYFKRWLLVETLCELRSDSTLSLLAEIVFSPIPKEMWSDPESFSQDKESDIRVTAMDGISFLAKNGNKNAEELLTKFFQHDDLSVRRRAIRGYLNIGDNYKERVSYLKRIISKNDHWLISLDVTDPKTVPYPDIPENLSAGDFEKLDSTPQIEGKEK